MLVAESAETGDFSEMLPLITETLFFPLRSGHISGTFLPALNTTMQISTMRVSGNIRHGSPIIPFQMPTFILRHAFILKTMRKVVSDTTLLAFRERQNWDRCIFTGNT